MSRQSRQPPASTTRVQSQSLPVKTSWHIEADRCRPRSILSKRESEYSAFILTSPKTKPHLPREESVSPSVQRAVHEHQWRVTMGEWASKWGLGRSPSQPTHFLWPLDHTYLLLLLFLLRVGRGLASLKVQLVTIWRPAQPVQDNIVQDWAAERGEVISVVVESWGPSPLTWQEGQYKARRSFSSGIIIITINTTITILSTPSPSPPENATREAKLNAR